MRARWYHKGFGIVFALGLIGMALYGIGHWAWEVLAR